MKSELSIKEHSLTSGEQIIEVTYGGKLVCTVTGAEGPGVRIISKHVGADTAISQCAAKEPTPGVIEVKFPRLQ